MTGRDPARLMFPQWEEPKYSGGGDLHFVTPKTAMHAEGRSANLPNAIPLQQPTAALGFALGRVILRRRRGKRSVAPSVPLCVPC